MHVKVHNCVDRGRQRYQECWMSSFTECLRDTGVSMAIWAGKLPTCIHECLDFHTACMQCAQTQNRPCQLFVRLHDSSGACFDVFTGKPRHASPWKMQGFYNSVWHPARLIACLISTFRLLLQNQCEMLPGFRRCMRMDSMSHGTS